MEQAKEAWASAQQRQAQYANQKRREVDYKVGDSLLLSTKKIRLKSPGGRKLLPKWIGPYKVRKRVGTVAYQMDLPKELKIHDVFHVSLLHPYNLYDISQMEQFSHLLLASLRFRKSLRFR